MSFGKVDTWPLTASSWRRGLGSGERDSNRPAGMGATPESLKASWPAPEGAWSCGLWASPSSEAATLDQGRLLSADHGNCHTGLGVRLKMSLLQ